MKKIYNKNSIILKLSTIFIVFFVIFNIIIQLLPTNYCLAESQAYFYITQNTLLIPTDQNIKGNVQIHSTYYVQDSGNPEVIINDITYKNVIYNGIQGLVASSALSKKSINNVANPFFKSSSLITINSEEDDILMFFNIVDNQTECIKLANNSKLEYIAYSEDGKFVLARLSNDSSKVGYVAKKYCSPTIIFTPNPAPINPDDEVKPPDLTAENKNPETKNDKATITRIVLISVLCIFAVFVVFLIFKPSHTKHKKNFKDDFYEN